MLGTDTTVSRLPAARAFIAGAAILAGSMSAGEVRADAVNDETAMAVPRLSRGLSGAALPDVLTPSDAAHVRHVFDLQASGDMAAAAAEAEISAATFSRVENGHMPDLATFAKICSWLERDPREFLGFQAQNDAGRESTTVHFRKKKTVSQPTAVALGDLILAAQAAIRARSRANE